MRFGTRSWLAYWPLMAALSLGAFLLIMQPAREWSATVIVLAWLSLCGLCWYRTRTAHPQLTAEALPVVYASQSGQARQIAERSAQQLTQGNLPAMAIPLDHLTVDAIASHPRMLLVLATYGEGESPDNGARFLRLLDTQQSLRNLSFALLGLGDSHYRQFCGFARTVDDRLRQLGATALFDRLEVDRLAAATLSRWQWQLGQLCGQPNYEEWTAPRFAPWKLTARQWLNPGSQGAPVYRIRLSPLEGTPAWRAGDIAEIAPRLPSVVVQSALATLGLTDPSGTLSRELAARRWPADLKPLQGLDAAQLRDQLPHHNHRDYSIASLPAEQDVELLVRLTHHPDGTPGLGSGWLCLHAALGEQIDLRIRANPSFHLPADTGPLILIGNGTGLAGLLAHLREREALGQSGHWMLFGERNRKHDTLLADQLDHWVTNGHLTHLDRVFSRDQPERRYVQHLLRDQADRLREWIDRGATVLVCGSLAGMGRDVDALLRGLLGAEQVDALAKDGRYRRDLY